jgi:hypothetical protein
VRIDARHTNLMSEVTSRHKFCLVWVYNVGRLAVEWHQNLGDVDGVSFKNIL